MYKYMKGRSEGESRLFIVDKLKYKKLHLKVFFIIINYFLM